MREMKVGNEIAISVKQVKKSFKKKPVLKGVDIEVEKGSIFALLGSNGAGKTTLIKIMTTLLKLDQGQVKIGGYDVQKDSLAARRLFSLTGQFAATEEDLTGRRNLQIIGELNHLKQVDKKSTELLKKFHLEEAADKLVSSYSGGMRRRLDIAMSLMSEPEIIFLDEPTTGLDPQNRAAMWEMIKSLRDTGKTIFLTTQYLEEAEALADKIAILNDGIIIKEGTATELKSSLPQGMIEFSFQRYEELSAAKELLKEYRLTENKDNLTLAVATNGSIQQLSFIFNQLNEAAIPIASFTQKLPTLEDAFYTFIGENAKEAK